MMEQYNALMQWLTEQGVEPGVFWAVAVPAMWTWFAGLWQTVEWVVGVSRFVGKKWSAWRERVGLRRLAREEAEENRLIAMVERRLAAKRSSGSSNTSPETGGTTSSAAKLVKIDLDNCKCGASKVNGMCPNHCLETPVATSLPVEKYKCPYCHRIGTGAELISHLIPNSQKSCQLGSHHPNTWHKLSGVDLTQRWECLLCHKTGTIEEMCGHKTPAGGDCDHGNHPDVRHWQKIEEVEEVKKCHCGYVGTDPNLHLIPGTSTVCSSHTKPRC